MSYETVSQRPEVSRYWVLRGTFHADGVSGVDVAWADVAVRHQDGLLRPVLAERPGAFTVGLPDAVGAPPSAVSVHVRLVNHDGALDAYLEGGATTATEFTSHSFYNFSGAIYEGVIDSDGTCYEHRWTPTLVVDGPVEHANGIIALSLAGRDDKILGRSKRIMTAAKLADATLVAGSATIFGFGARYSSDDDVWAEVTDAIGRGGASDTVAPWAYGRAVLPLEDVSGDDSPRQYLAYVSITEPGDAQLSSGWTVYGERDGAVEQIPSSGPRLASYTVQVDAEDDDGNTVRLWVMGCTDLTGSISEKYGRLWIVPESYNLCGYARYATATVADVVRSIVEEHSELGASAIDSASFDAATAALTATSGIVGGVLADTTAISEVIQYLGPPWQFGFQIGSDDTLRVYVPGWSADDETAAALTLPSLRHGDIMPSDESGASSWAETEPTDPEDRGAPLTRLWIDWAQDQQAMWTPAQRPTYAPGVAQVPVASETEARIPGGWLYPPSATQALEIIGSQRAFATRQAGCTTHLWLAARGTMAMLRATHRHGLGYDRRLFRLLRAHIMPREGAAQLEMEDLGAMEAQKPGVLDAISYWVAHNPGGSGVAITLDSGSGMATVGTSTFTAAMVDAHLWAFGAATEGNRRAWRIIDVPDSRTLQLEPKPVATETISASAAGTATIDQAWMVVHSEISKGAAYRSDKIRACEEASGEFTDGVAGFQYTSR